MRAQGEEEGADRDEAVAAGKRGGGGGRRERRRQRAECNVRAQTLPRGSIHAIPPISKRRPIDRMQRIGTRRRKAVAKIQEHTQEKTRAHAGGKLW